GVDPVLDFADRVVELVQNGVLGVEELQFEIGAGGLLGCLHKRLRKAVLTPDEVRNSECLDNAYHLAIPSRRVALVRTGLLVRVSHCPYAALRNDFEFIETRLAQEVDE
ncbi:MAG: hypothetical protein JJ899_17065, partial [Alphaproteobacteria bacterium]|nr:hypothetical protein [Alphaproteobacteria bacterium]